MICYLVLNVAQSFTDAISAQYFGELESGIEISLYLLLFRVCQNAYLDSYNVLTILSLTQVSKFCVCRSPKLLQNKLLVAITIAKILVWYIQSMPRVVT